MNRLQYETSPYLLQHQENPVDWYPWGDEAFEKARKEDKPILLSVGYSACHWCHVMAHESFEHPETADIMNRLYVNIKVDREERPDVDNIYMQAVQAMNNGHGGWPMTVFMTPDGNPFYGGTYYPLEPRYGMPSFRQILEAIHEAYQTRRDEVEQQAEQLTQSLNRDVLGIGRTDDSGFDHALLDSAVTRLATEFDSIHGGFGAQPKFPNPMNLEFLLRQYQRTRDPQTLHMVTFTLQKMAKGGIYDQVGGGFSRYSVDAEWLVPHFEKMLYDNAQLSRIYLHTWQVTGDEFYKNIAVEIYDYVLREMTSPEGGFYSATDADSEGEEGKFFVWSLEEITAALAPIEEDIPNATQLAIAYFGVTQGGNFEGKNILYVPHDDADIAKEFDITFDELTKRITLIKDRLYAVRTSRVAPGLDDKSLASWNGMMLASLAEAARILERDDYQQAAERAGEFILNNLIHESGVYRTYKNGISKISGYLEDYAHIIDAFLELYQTTFLDHWFTAANNLADITLKHFRASDGGFYDTNDEAESLIVRPRTLQDNATPAGNTMIAKQLLRLTAYTGNSDYDDAARRTLRLLVEAMRQYPQAFGEALNATDMLVNGITEIAIVGNPAKAQTKEILRTIRLPFRPNIVTALTRENADENATIPLLQYRVRRNDQPTVYVCRNFVCDLPVNTIEEITTKLENS